MCCQSSRKLGGMKFIGVFTILRRYAILTKKIYWNSFNQFYELSPQTKMPVTMPHYQAFLKIGVSRIHKWTFIKIHLSDFWLNNFANTTCCQITKKKLVKIWWKYSGLCPTNVYLSWKCVICYTYQKYSHKNSLIWFDYQLRSNTPCNKVTTFLQMCESSIHNQYIKIDLNFFGCCCLQ